MEQQQDAAEDQTVPTEATSAPEPGEAERGDAVAETADATQDAPAGSRPRTRGIPNLVKVAVALAAIAISVGFMSEYAQIIAPLFLGVNLLVTAYPIYLVLKRHRVPAWLASLCTLLAVLLVLVVGIALLSWCVTAMVGLLGDYSAQFTDLYRSSIQFLARFGFDEAALLEQLKGISPSSVLDVLGGVLSNASGATGLILVLLTAMVFMTMDLPSFAERLSITDKLHPSFADSIESFAVGIRRYWLVTTIFGLIVAVLDGVVLVALGVPLAVVWAVLSFVTNYIPNIGFVIGLLPPALVALFDGGPVPALIVVIAYSVLNFVIQTIIQPKFAGDAVGITPTMSFVSLLVWTAVFGALGALLALPITLFIKAMLIDNDPRMRWVNAIIAANPKQIDTNP